MPSNGGRDAEENYRRLSIRAHCVPCEHESRTRQRCCRRARNRREPRHLVGDTVVATCSLVPPLWRAEPEIHEQEWESRGGGQCGRVERLDEGKKLMNERLVSRLGRARSLDEHLQTRLVDAADRRQRIGAVVFPGWRSHLPERAGRCIHTLRGCPCAFLCFCRIVRPRPIPSTRWVFAKSGCRRACRWTRMWRPVTQALVLFK